MNAPPSITIRPEQAAVAEQLQALFEDGAPAVIRGLSGLFDIDEVFDWIRVAHTAKREKNALQKIRALKTVWHLAPPVPADPSLADPGRPAELFCKGGLLLDTAPFLPTAEDADFAAWVARTREALGGDFGMQAPGLECASWNALDRLQGLLAPTLRLTGPRSYRFNAFCGDYRLTPFGYHLDPNHEAVFQYVVHGSRKGKFWEGLVLNDDDADWVEDTNGRVAPAREPDVVFDLEPGDLVFWPGTHVHGFEVDGPSMGLSMVIDRTSPRNRGDILAGLEISTAGGRAALPAIVQGADVGIGEVIRRRSRYSIRYERFDDELLVGISGRTFGWPDRLSTVSAMHLFDYLEQHSEVAVKDVIEACTDEWLAPEEVVETLTMLRAFGYLF